ncbi:MAG: hypothetical protein KKA42_06415 [candidate division Zixibacteria bacterium]|nr:hypothetical protein [candidate division Zixibacteria bacterium]
MTRFRAFVILLFALLVFDIAAVSAQTYNPFNQRDDQYRLLGLKRAREAYESAQAEYDRQKVLFDKGHITRNDLERSRTVFTDAEVNYQQSLLAVLFEEQYISISEAVKYQAGDGRKHVRLKLVNTSGGTAEFRKLLNIDEDLFRALQPDIISNVYVSLLNSDNAIISQPYEQKLNALRYGEPAVIDFALLQDLDAVNVFLVYGNGSQRNMKIFLQKDASVNQVAVQSEQFSQEVELGTSSSYDLTLELYSGESNTFSLEVVNLPREIGRYFAGEADRVRLSQLKFTESTNTKRASLKVNLPDRPSDNVIIDAPIPFYVLVLPRERLRELGDIQDKAFTEDEIRALDVGYVRLELLPRGAGELLVRAPQLYASIASDDSAVVSFEVLNEGSHRLDNIEIKADLPLSWTKNIEPSSIASLDIGEDARVRMQFTPPADVAPGRYEVRVRTTAMSNNRPVSSEDKTVTIEVRSETNVMGTTAIVLAVLTLVGGIVVYGVRLSRR